MKQLQRSPRTPSARAGFSIIEVLISATVVIVALMGMVGSVTSSAVLGESNRVTALAYEALHRVVEGMHGEEFSEVLALFNTDPADDPDGPGTAPGSGFTVAGLSPRDDDDDGLVGAVLLPLAGAPGTLREDHDDPDFGMPRDLNGDGAIDADDRADDYLVLPVMVRLDWSGRSGRRHIEMECLLSPR